MPTKSIVALKSGRTEIGRMAAVLHAGAKAGPDDAVSGVFRQLGIIRAYDMFELFDYARILASQRPLEGEKIAIITSGGGYGVIATDYIEDPNVGAPKIGRLSKAFKSKLREFVPPFASIENPIALTGNVTDQMFDKAFEILNNDPGVEELTVKTALALILIFLGLVMISS